jgi:hypothetical protein
VGVVGTVSFKSFHGTGTDLVAFSQPVGGKGREGKRGCTSRIGSVELDVRQYGPVLEGYDGFHDAREGCGALAVAEIGLAGADVDPV